MYVGVRVWVCVCVWLGVLQTQNQALSCKLPVSLQMCVPRQTKHPVGTDQSGTSLDYLFHKITRFCKQMYSHI